ncbi:hypothetical protein GCM10025857_14720 [Alicyclobacillus contaminans]|nr:hypothetical protein GCM10025857_14720 [Alicyclobacillus contaminans]
MTTNYPNGIDQFPIHQDNASETILAGTINNLQDAVIALQQTVGYGATKPTSTPTPGAIVKFDENGQLTISHASTADTATNATNATTAANANQLGGQPPSYYAAASSVPNTGSQTFTSSGTFTVPNGVYRIFVQLWGGGGGGGSGSAGFTNSGTTKYYSGGGGGGAGAYAEGWISVTPGQQIPVTIGLGGAGGTPVSVSTIGATQSGNIGTNGGNTAVGGLIALGGAGGTQGMASSSGSPVTSAGGNGGTYTAPIGVNGNAGSGSTTNSTNVWTPGGNGGSSNMGSGGTGGTSINANGADATNVAAGGGGGASYFSTITSGSSGKGGNGANGKVVIWY